MKVAFIGHPAHQSTKSSKFFLEILSNHDVTTFFPTADTYQSCLDIDKNSYDRVVCWQYDFFAPFFLAKGLPTVVIPMFDGSGGKPDKYWLSMAGAQFINFSWHFHLRILNLGLPSIYAKYFCNPAHYKVADFSHGELRAFLWQRNPKMVNWQTVLAGTASQLSSFHLHNAPDTADNAFPGPLPGVADAYKITESRWFDDKSELDRVVDSCNIYYAPRTAEGIGMGMIEAMARGMCVIAHDLPTHNEYVANRVNGILFRANDPNWTVDLSEASIYGPLARKTVEIGYQNWLERVPLLVKAIEDTAITDVPSVNENEALHQISNFFT